MYKISAMQCESCEEFNPCISLCPKKTCDNRLVYGVIEKQCDDFKGICFEGCDLHPCPPGQVSSLVDTSVCFFLNFKVKTFNCFNACNMYYLQELKT